MPPISATSAAIAAASSGKPDEEFPDFGPISSALAGLAAAGANGGGGDARAADLATGLEGAAALVASPVVLLHGPAKFNTVQ